VQPTPEQQRVLSDVVHGFDHLPGIKDPDERNAERLRLMDRARKLSLDVRFVEKRWRAMRPSRCSMSALHAPWQLVVFAQPAAARGQRCKCQTSYAAIGELPVPLIRSRTTTSEQAYARRPHRIDEDKSRGVMARHRVGSWP
jgi:hypothetical protein